ncbi:unnamed protein product [Meganyctiphanes norvegica]|uniref:Uncharacterized protein n=1 Tax=Meganyctiphanes norvegica TaxID=48144 RepID=A0AAV2PJK7_MEGNR
MSSAIFEKIPASQIDCCCVTEVKCDPRVTSHFFIRVIFVYVDLLLNILDILKYYANLLQASPIFCPSLLTASSPPLPSSSSSPLSPQSPLHLYYHQLPVESLPTPPSLPSPSPSAYLSPSAPPIQPLQMSSPPSSQPPPPMPMSFPPELQVSTSF